LKNKDSKQLTENIKAIAGSMKIVYNARSRDCKWTKELGRELPNLIAQIFALWSVLSFRELDNMIAKSKVIQQVQQIEGKMSSDRKKYIFEPHPAQVLAIFRMLGLGYASHNVNVKEDRLNKNLVQIGTGEGKSVTLAVTAAVLSLVGFEVYCVCYSKYLSDRDYNAFKLLFEYLNINNNIHYGTFSRICEEVINSRGDLREIAKNYILEGVLKGVKHNTDDQPRVLLIDEVDVFFSNDFYGNSYKPSVSLSNQHISNFISYIWKNKEDIDGLISSYKSSPEFEAFLACFRFGKEASNDHSCEDLALEACKEMLSELKNFDANKVDYVVQDDQIGYKDQDNIVFDINYGYKTLFTYFVEHAHGKVSQHSLNQYLSMLVRLGSFSYAEIPLSNFYSILGVTGNSIRVGSFSCYRY
jgi:hypothetical protein